MPPQQSASRIVRLASAELASPVRKQAWIGIAAALGLTIAKFFAWRLTGSVGFYSDMLESLTVVAGAGIAVAAVRVAGRAPDARHAFGHAKAEYFASLIDAILIFVTTALILTSAIDRLRHPQAVQNGWYGVILALGSSIFSIYFARRLFTIARTERSISLEAEARHLVVSAIVSLGVVTGVVFTLLTGWQRLDPIIALVVGFTAGVTGIVILADSLQGLMDSQVDRGSLAAIERVLADDAATLGIVTLGVRTRAAGSEDFVEVTVAMPSAWTVDEARTAIARLERDLAALQPGRHVTVVLGAAASGEAPSPLSA
ncbi:MAG TPA: cation diffusion facilitator family transporter [Thermomicrobiales bacterium]|nr:cation diffusion facilitator family transporter [Thermomicrobiales bacterium]